MDPDNFSNIDDLVIQTLETPFPYGNMQLSDSWFPFDGSSCDFLSTPSHSSDELAEVVGEAEKENVIDSIQQFTDRQGEYNRHLITCDTADHCRSSSNLLLRRTS